MPLNINTPFKKRNPLAERIFDFESSDDDFDDTPIDPIFSHKKCKTLDM